MIPIGIGLDLVDVSRVERLITDYAGRALDRLLTSGEREYCLSQAAPARHVAARVAAKEAAYKALAADGADAGYVGWREIEVTREMDGRPGLVFHGRAKQTAERLKVVSALVSLTHSDTHAAAVVILLR